MGPRKQPPIRWPWVAAFATMAVAALLALSELDRLVRDLLDNRGAGWSFSYVFGPGRTGHPSQGEQAWNAWLSLPHAEQHTVSTLLFAHLGCDVVFIAAYVLLARALFRGRAPHTLRVTLALAGFDLVEDVLAGIAAACLATDHSAPTPLLWLIGAATTLKWLATLALVIAVIRFVVAQASPRRTVGRVLFALYLQRYSVVAVAPIIVLVYGPGGEILDQLPDVQRRWFDSWGGWTSFLASAVTLTLLAVAIVVMGRLRASHLVSERTGGPDTGQTAERRGADEQPSPWLWAIPPGAVAALAVGTRLLGGEVDWTPLGLITGVCAAVVGVSAFLDWLASRHHIDTALTRPPARGDATLAQLATSVGDALAVAVLSAGGLGLVRALTSEVVLGRWWVGLVELAGATGAVLLWPVAAWAGARVLPTAQADGAGEHSGLFRLLRFARDALIPSESSSPGLRPRIAVTLASIGAALLLAQSLFPVPTGRYIGVFATTSLALTGLVAIGATVVVVSQNRRPQSVFVALGMRTTPVISLAVIASFVIWGTSGDRGVHGIQGLGSSAGTAAAARPTLDQAFASWNQQASPCDRVVDVPTAHGSRPLAIRPMLLVAADGGGIRAAYWTVSAFRALADGLPQCGSHVTLLSSGVSGGSVGLALTSLAGPDRATSAVETLSGPTALGSAAVGFLLRDNLASVTGAHLPAYDFGGHTTLSGSRWQDRATLMEGVWSREASGLGFDQPFVRDWHQPGGQAVTGGLVLNSTSVGTQCRVLVSQIVVDHTTVPTYDNGGTARDPLCRNGSTPLPATFDLLGDYAAGSGANDPGCLQNLSTVTAAMLSARFPFITPSGVVGPCRGLSSQQLIDGGYAESTGLGTLVDLAPDWSDLVRENNAAAVAQLGAAAAPATPPVVVVPMIALLQNHFGTDVRPSTSSQTNELQVPLKGRGAKDVQLDTSTLLQRASDATGLDQVCPSDPGTASAAPGAQVCPTVQAAVDSALPWRVLVIAPDTRPAVTAPLGWVLSRESRAGLDRSIDAQSVLACGIRTTAYCTAGYGRLADLLDELAPPRGQ